MQAPPVSPKKFPFLNFVYRYIQPDINQCTNLCYNRQYLLTIAPIHGIDAFYVQLAQSITLHYYLARRIGTIWFCRHYLDVPQVWTVVHD